MRATCASTTAATFRTAVREGRADGIMTAYNQINGVPGGACRRS